jgi:hypothetical protein
MINAREARTLAEESTVQVAKRVERIGENIRKQAELGARELLLKHYLFNEPWMEIERRPFNAPDYTPIQRLVKKELERVGFTVDIACEMVTIGGGFKSMEAGHEEEQSFIRVRW